MEKVKRIYGWITGNNLRVRGYYEGDKGKPDGEPWYTEIETGQGWSGYDVSFEPDKTESP